MNNIIFFNLSSLVTLLRYSLHVEINQLASCVTANNIQIWRLIYDVSPTKVTIINEMISNWNSTSYWKTNNS